MARCESARTAPVRRQVRRVTGTAVPNALSPTPTWCSGLINPDGLLPMDVAKAEQSVVPIARHFGLPVAETAAGIYRVVNANMAAAIRQMTVEKGIDPRDFTLLAFGGAGGQHAAVLAEEVGIPEVVAPDMASVFSAFGMVNAPLKISRATSLMRPLDDSRGAMLRQVFRATGGRGEWQD